jgi:hypothetical protein
LIVDFSHASASDFATAAEKVSELLSEKSYHKSGIDPAKLTELSTKTNADIAAFNAAAGKFDLFTKDSGLKNSWASQLEVAKAKSAVSESLRKADGFVTEGDGPGKLKEAMTKFDEASNKYVGSSAELLRAGVFLIQNIAPITIPASLVAGIGSLCAAHFAAPKSRGDRAAWAIGLSLGSLLVSGGAWWMQPEFYKTASNWIATTSYMQECVAFAGVAMPIATLCGLYRWVSDSAANNVSGQSVKGAHSPQDAAGADNNTEKDSYFAKFPLLGSQVPSNWKGYAYSGGIGLALISLLAAGAIYFEFTEIMDVMYPGIAGAVGLGVGAIGFTQLEWTSAAAQAESDAKAKK